MARGIENNPQSSSALETDICFFVHRYRQTRNIIPITTTNHPPPATPRTLQFWFYLIYFDILLGTPKPVLPPDPEGTSKITGFSLVCMPKILPTLVFYAFL
jgi:hypothetical protein